VRELENAVARLLTLTDGGELGPASLSVLTDQAPVQGAPAGSIRPLSLREQLDALERDILATTLAAAGGNQSETARRLGVTRTTLLDKLKRHGLHGAR
jgi:two-component system response regulator AtoC